MYTEINCLFLLAIFLHGHTLTRHIVSAWRPLMWAQSLFSFSFFLSLSAFLSCTLSSIYYSPSIASISRALTLALLHISSSSDPLDSLVCTSPFSFTRQYEDLILWPQSPLPLSLLPSSLSSHVINHKHIHSHNTSTNKVKKKQIKC